MRRHPLWYLCFLSLFLLLFYLLRQDRPPELPAEPVAAAPASATRPATVPPPPVDESIVVRAPLSDGEAGQAVVRLRGVLLADGEPVDTGGRLEVSLPDSVDSGDTPAAVLEVVQGRFEATGELARRLLDADLEPGDLLYWTADGIPCRCESLSRQESEDGEFLLAAIGTQRKLKIQVTDLAQRPVEGARVQVAAPWIYVPPGGLPTTTAEGTVVVDLFGSLPLVRLRVSKLGYQTVSQKVDLESGDEWLSIRLARLLAYGIINDHARRVNYVSFPPPARAWLVWPWRVDWRPYLDEVERRLNLGPTEFVQWSVLGEVEWCPPDTVVRHSITGRNGPEVRFETPLRMITDPDLAVVRIPQEAMGGPPRYWAVDVSFVPDASFLAREPKILDLRFVPSRDAKASLASDEPGLVRRGTRQGPGVYRYWLPAGRYEIAEDAKKSDDLGLGLSPHLLPGVEFMVGPEQGDVRVTASLAPGEAWIGYQVTDRHSRILNTAAQILDADEEELDNSFYSPETGPWFRFLRPGLFKLCLEDKRKHRKRVVLADLRWPAPVTEQGIWIVKVPDFDPEDAISRFE